MSVTYVVTAEVLSSFREPFGILIKGSSLETAKKLKDLLQQEQPTMVIAVGDTVSRNLERHSIGTHLFITDNKSHRRKLSPRVFLGKSLVKVSNPPGTITQEAIAAIQKTISGPEPVHLLVDGEEDLLTLIAVLYAPENAFVLYGQPHVGMVVVKVTPQKRVQAERILKQMKTTKKKN